MKKAKYLLIAIVLTVFMFPVFTQARRQPRRRVIFNCDGSSVFSTADGDIDRWIDNIFGPFDNSCVDTLFWCDGSGGNTAGYDSKVLELSGQRIGKVNPHLVKWIAEGNDPPKVVVNEAHKRGLEIFYSFRINDIHDSFIPEELPTFKEQHPEWTFGQKAYFGEYPTALNFLHAEVRQLKLKTIEEIFDKYDFDGLELDFMRSPIFLPPYQEYRYTVIMTDFLRTVRKRLNARAQQRGRPIWLAVRVGENLEACRLDGFDVPTWVKESLLDIIVASDHTRDIDIETFKELTKGSSIEVFACLHPYKTIITGPPTTGHTWMPGSETANLMRALAANYWQQGADGIYTFNWFPHLPDCQYQIALLKEICNPEILATKDRTFCADVADFGPGAHDHPWGHHPNNWMFVSLPVTLHKMWDPKSLTTIPVRVAGTENAESVRLFIRTKNLAPDDSIDIYLNGRKLSEMPQPQENGVIEYPLKPNQLTIGQNNVGFRLNHRGPAAKDDIIVDAVEIHLQVMKK